MFVGMFIIEWMIVIRMEEYFDGGFVSVVMKLFSDFMVCV